MITQTHVRLCELAVLIQLGTDLGQLIKLLATIGPVPLNVLLTHINNAESLQNQISILIKHGIISASLNSAKQIYYYSLNIPECLLRLSLPRYLSEVK